MKNTDNLYAVIMAGGVGSRFWPVSTPEFPKQFHDLLGVGKSFIQQTFSRLAPLIPKENILVSTNKNYAALVLEQLPEVTKRQLVLEPAMRNTAPAILYAVMKIYAQNPNAVILIAPSDHWIDREEVFLDKLKEAFKICSQDDILMTLGIVPTYPNTGYGYIQFDNKGVAPHPVTRFTEKPDYDTAISFFKSGEYLWNAGIFIWSAHSILKAFQSFEPDLYALFAKGLDIYNTIKEQAFIQENYPKAKNISVDYAILEKAKNIKVLPADMGWNDLGTWGALYEKLSEDNQGNALVQAQLTAQNATGNIVRTSAGKRVVLQDVQDMIIVEHKDILLILPRAAEQDIKSLSQKL